MASWPVPKLLFSMGLPAVFSMLIQAMYNIVDTIYISRFSQDALFAIGLVTPVQMIGLSIAMGSAVGVSTLVSRRLGEQRRDEANKVASTGFVLTFFHMLIAMGIGLFLSVPFLRLFTSRPEIIDFGYTYLKICMGVCFGQFFSVLFERLLQAQGNMIVPMFAQLIGAITNIVLDPVFIFGAGFIPAFGIAGAAIATVAGQILSLIFLSFILLTRKHDVSISLKDFSFNKERLGDIYAVALPSAIMQAIGSFTTILLNNCLVDFSEEAVSSLSMYFKLQSFVFMPVFGFNQGALPIMSYNYGARNPQRFKDTVKYFLITAALFMGLGTYVFRYHTSLVLSFFEMTPSLEAIATVTLKNISLSFVMAAFSIIIGTVFQAFGKGTMSMIQSILRQIGFLVPLAYLFARTGRLELVWYAYPIAEFLVLVIFLPLAIKAFRMYFDI